jgi:hypothetical protein
VLSLSLIMLARHATYGFSTFSGAFHHGADEALVSLIQSINDGSADPSLFDFIGDSRVVALEKPDGGGVRPIAIGDCLARIAGNCVCTTLQDDFAAFFTSVTPGLPKDEPRPLQLGVGTKGGSETAIHSIRFLLEANPSWAVASNDLRNGFNSLSRATMLKRIRDSPFASMLPSLQRMYLREGRLLTAHGPLRSTPNEAIDAAGLRHPNPNLPGSADLDEPCEYTSSDGCRQGDPHGPSQQQDHPCNKACYKA